MSVDLFPVSRAEFEIADISPVGQALTDVIVRADVICPHNDVSDKTNSVKKMPTLR